MNLPTNDQLQNDYFKSSALSYFQYGNSSMVNNNSIYEINGQNLILRYPTEYAKLDNRIKLPRHLYLFWSVIGKYVPNDSYISNAYVSPNDQAYVGLSMLEDNYPGVNLSKYKDKQTNPELIGKYGSNYLFEFNYDSVKKDLLSKNVIWSKPNCSVHQRGLAIDISSNNNISILIKIIEWFKQNNTDSFISNLIKQSSNTLHIEFSESILSSYNIPENTFLLNHSFGSGVSSVLKNKEGAFYDILKANGHKDLIDCGLPSSTLSRLPETAKRQNYFLGKAIKEILENVLGGQNGIISGLVQNEVEYALSLSNGAIGALKRLGAELDTLTEGRASRLICEAIESEAIKTVNSSSIKNKLMNFSPITPDDYPGINVFPSQNTYNNNLTTRKSNIQIASDNINDSFKDTKNTPNNEDVEYDSLRANNTDSITLLTYDHYLSIDDNKIDYYESKTMSTYVQNVFNETLVNISHNLNRTVDIKCYDTDGNAVVGDYNIIDSNNIQITFNPAFTGKVVIS